jgi:hypothetical protein
MKKTLNDILQDYQSIEVELIENNGEITDQIEKELHINESDLSNKMDGYEKFARYLKHQSEYLKSLEDHYNKRRKVIDNSILKFKDRMIEAMKITDNNKIKTDEFNFSIGTSKRYKINEEKLNDEIQESLIEDGLGENVFKANLTEIKSKYKDQESPEWLNIEENDFLRVS